MPRVLENQSALEIREAEFRLAFSQARVPKSRSYSIRTEDDGATPETIPLSRLHLASAGIKYLSAIIQQLVELRNDDETDEYGDLRASKFAFDMACQLITDAAIIAARSRREIPRGCASTSAQGGVRIEWVRPTASVHLVIPATPARDAYIYHENATGHCTEPASPDRLASRLSAIK
jgi:hypothetical protein